MSCMGCEQQALSMQWAYDLKKQEAIRYAKEHQTNVAIFMEGGNWSFVHADILAGRPVREIIYFDSDPIAGAVH